MWWLWGDLVSRVGKGGFPGRISGLDEGIACASREVHEKEEFAMAFP